MSFRARLTIFFVLIVVVPMVAIGVLMFSLINDSEQGKADARAGGVAAEAGSVYESEAASASTDAGTLARALGSARGKALSVRFAALATQAGLARATLSDGSKTIVAVGHRTAIAPGSVIARDPATGQLHDRDRLRAHRLAVRTRALVAGHRGGRTRRTEDPRLDGRVATLIGATGGRERDAP